MKVRLVHELPSTPAARRPRSPARRLLLGIGAGALLAAYLGCLASDDAEDDSRGCSRSHVLILAHDAAADGHGGGGGATGTGGNGGGGQHHDAAPE